MKKQISIAMVCVLYMAMEVAKADFTFGTPANVGTPVNSASEDFNASISADGLSLYFISDRPGGVGGRDIWVTTRETTNDVWSEPVNLGPTINTPAGEWGVSISYDGLSLYFDTRQPGTSSAINDLWVATRATTDEDWANPVSLGPKVNSSADDYTPSISSDELELYFTSGPGRGGHGNYDIWVSRRETKYDPWGTAVNLGPTVNGSGFDTDPAISADGLLLFFQSTRPGGLGGECDIWLTKRATTDDPWGEPVNLGPTINSSAAEDYPNVSADGSTLFFRYSYSNKRNGGGDIWQAPIIPIVDFNNDGIVDSADIVIMVDNWGTNNQMCDIGPMPWGDGIVDVEDLKVLAEHLFEEIVDPTLVAHWPLDEAQGTTAYDNAATCDGTLMGGPVWQPEGGMVSGALAFDGIDDYVSTDPVLNPADGKFSVVVWVKGGAPGRVVLSQADGSNWLCTDSIEGCLMTELKASGRGVAGPLLSQTVIVDDTWHRIGLVWDGSYRYLYADGAEVAKDAAPLSGSASAEGGLHFGAGSTLAPGTFFSGLIDDVRIYNRAVIP